VIRPTVTCADQHDPLAPWSAWFVVRCKDAGNVATLLETSVLDKPPARGQDKPAVAVTMSQSSGLRTPSGRRLNCVTYFERENPSASRGNLALTDREIPWRADNPRGRFDGVPRG
jgi:hypothetical protein